LKRQSAHNRFYNWTEPFFVRMNDAYRRYLDSFMERRWLAFVVMAIAVGIIFFLGGSLQSELAPAEDRSQLRINAVAQEGTSYDFMDNYMDQLVNVAGNLVPEREALISLTAPGGSGGAVNSGFVNIILTDSEDRDRSQQQIGAQLNGAIRKLNDARAFVIQDQSIGSRRASLPVQYVIQASDFEKLKKVIPPLP
ncbi:MAG TPA: efflux RND transporter permease subunit, partial [Ignavibacteriales bacterium]|nr:efflux RND transporter permease subunit [Ignavibacteriales bacterium]